MTLGVTQLQGLELAQMHLAAPISLDLTSPFELSIPPSVLTQKLPPLAHNECAGTEFVILILIHYESWTSQSKDGQSMQLDSVKKDLRLLLDHLKFRHDETDRAWHILADFECMYKDYAGAEQLVTRAGLPNRETILKIIQQTTKNGGSGFIHYGGHCHYGAPGTSKLETQGTFTVFSETQDCQLGRKAAYLICSDGQRIYGNEFFARLPDVSNTGKPSTIMLVLDTCSAAGFTADSPALPYKYDPEAIPMVELPPSLHTKSLNQMIVVTSSRLHEKAGAFNGCGALTLFMIEYLQECPNASVIDLIRHLDAQCATQPDHRRRQHPQIRSRYPLDGPFLLNNSLEPWSQSRTSSAFMFISDDIARKAKTISSES